MARLIVGGGYMGSDCSVIQLCDTHLGDMTRSAHEMVRRIVEERT